MYFAGGENRKGEKMSEQQKGAFLFSFLTFSVWRGALSSSSISLFLSSSFSLSLSYSLLHRSSQPPLTEYGNFVKGNGGDDPLMYRDGGKATAAGGNEGSSSAIVVELDEGRPKEAIWQMNIREGETWESGPYPERPGEPDCAYYIRTGLCRFGMTCKYNHPPNTKLAVAAARLKGNYPEQAGQPECQYYMRTGTCKFGATCKFHHPRDKAGSAARVQSNILGYPLRPNEKECAYYLRTGICKFGNTCKFHHPQPYGTIISPRASPVYPPVHSSTAHGQQSYAGGLTNWPMPRPSFVPNPRWQGPSNYAQVIVPQGMVQVSAWSPYSGQFTSVSSSGNQQQTQLTSQFYKTSRQNESTVVTRGTFSSFRSGAIPVGHYTMQTDSVFPERPDQPECQFYMKTGDCKFGAVCKFHHPRERLIPTPNCVLSPLGLPLRPGEASCVFYSRYGVCKFGPSCKFDHPIANFTYSTVASASDIPVVQGFVGSSSGPPALTLSSNADENIVAEGAHATSSIGQVASFIQSFAEKNKK